MHSLQPSGSPQQMAMAPTIWLKKKKKNHSSNPHRSVPFIYQPLKIFTTTLTIASVGWVCRRVALASQWPEPFTLAA